MFGQETLLDIPVDQKMPDGSTEESRKGPLYGRASVVLASPSDVHVTRDSDQSRSGQFEKFQGRRGLEDQLVGAVCELMVNFRMAMISKETVRITTDNCSSTPEPRPAIPKKGLSG